LSPQLQLREGRAPSGHIRVQFGDTNGSPTSAHSNATETDPFLEIPHRRDTVNARAGLYLDGRGRYSTFVNSRFPDSQGDTVMRSLSKALLALGVAVLLAGPTFAQGFRPGNPLKGLIENKDLQKELGVSDEQVKKAVTVADDIFKKHEDDFKDVDFRSPEGREKMMAANKTVSNETKKALSDIFDAKQMRRFNQVALQSTMRFIGPTIYADPDIQKDLKLNDEQKDKIKTLTGDLAKERDQMFKDAAGDPEKFQEVRKKMEGLNKETSDKISKLLSTEQKKAFEELKGEEFKFPMGRRGPPQ
jgi:hypothetical protein